jgi:2-polyprenyl-3-methyl-5-hydroxy-6-metoxy-1,4-benzoquinol methylase
MNKEDEKTDSLISSLYEIIDLLKTKKSLLNFNLKDLSSLRQALKSDIWPESIPNKETYDFQEHFYKFTANFINLEKMDVLFLGSEAELFFSYMLEKKANKVVCYSENKKDIFKTQETEESKLILTNNFEDILKNGAYDVIVCYDFIEHCDQHPEKIMTIIKNLRKSNGPIYIRTHPFSSRYHDHNYEYLNKAYTHLIFDDREKLKVGCLSGKKTCKELTTETEYFKLFYSLDLKINERYVVEHKPESFFFDNKLIFEKIKNSLNIEIVTPEEIGFEFIDYVLS